MPSPFGTGLISGVVQGWTKQSEQQDQLKRQQQQQQIENNLKIINAQDLPDDVKQSAAQQLQDLMQGKKPGAKGGGQLSPVLQNLLKMIGKSHGAGGAQGGMTENMPNGQPAPGTAGSTPGAGFPQSQQPPPTNTDPQSGRPTLAGTGNASTDPANAPQPQQGGQQPRQTSTLDAQIDATQRAIAGTQNPITKQKLVDRLGKLTDLQIKNEQEIAKEDRTETGKETLAKLKADNDQALQKLKAEQAEELEKARGEGRKALEEAQARHKKELEDLTEKHREELKKIASSLRPAKSGGESKAQTKRFEKIEDDKNKALSAAETRFAAAKAKADQLPPGTARGQALRDAMDALNNAKAQAQTNYTTAIKEAAKGGGQGGSDRVTVISPDGKKGTIPRSQLPEASQQGYKEVKEAA